MNRVTVMARMINPITVPVPIQTFWKYTLTRSCRESIITRSDFHYFQAKFVDERRHRFTVTEPANNNLIFNEQIHNEERKLIFKQYQVPLNRGSQPGLPYDEIILIHGGIARILFTLQEELEDEHGIQQNHLHELHELIIAANFRITSFITEFDVFYTIFNGTDTDTDTTVLARSDNVIKSYRGMQIYFEEADVEFEPILHSENMEY
uniref:Uncharacterized protein n=1 Tax=Salix viminalis TaxID=40686 RepID=A0A6N2N9C4_SALVM